MRPHRIALSACCALLLLTAHGSAQVVRGVVVDASGAPVRGAFVALLNEQGQQRSAVLAGEQGQFVFLTGPGRYSLRVDQIGHRTGTEPLFELTDRDTRTVRVVLEVAALRLPEISVRGTNRCVGRPEASRETAQVWNEARKALTIAAWVESRGTATFRYRLSERDLDLQLAEARQPRVRFQATAGKRAFSTADPDSLARFGYVQERRGETFLYGPDAELLLSNSFLNEHCFGLERSADRQGLIGLSFQPVSGRRLPDIRGVLWLDERTAELRFIEYSYTGLPFYADRRYAGGRTDFQQLPNGAWIVNRWYIRAPSLGRSIGSSDLRLIGSHESGGEVLDAQVAGSERAVLVPRVAIEGMVFDSVRGRPLEGARVYLSGTPFATVAGIAGKFRLDSVPAGLYYIAFEHPWVDSLPRIPDPVRLNTDSASLRNLQLAVPSAQRIIDDVCPPEERHRIAQLVKDTATSNRGVVFGAIHSASEVMSDVEVGVTWRRAYSFSGGPVRLEDIRIRPHSLAVSVEPDGRYTICAVPIDHPLQIDLNVRQRMVQRDSMRLLPHGMMRRDFSLPRR